MRRVVQFSTGNVGRHSLRALIGRPDLELVGVHAANPDKIGRDAAELCGLSKPTGVVATHDIDALIALAPDCVVYTALGETRPMEAIEQMSNLLGAGINVVGTSMVWLVTPRQADDWLRVPLEHACRAGDSSLYVNGIDPGYSGDTAVHAALSLVTRAGLSGVHKAIIEGEPRIEVSTHLSHPVLDITDAGCVSTAARAVNAIDWVCRAPAGLVAVEGIPPVEMIRGLMW